MDTPQNFRTAFNGFNREDVVRYLEYLNAKHAAQVNQLNAEAEFLRQKLLEAEAPAADQSRTAELEAARDGLQAQLEAAREENEALRRQLDTPDSQLEARLQDMTAQRDAALSQLSQAQQAAAPSLAEQELEAYRRAERAERVAQAQADKIYDQASGVLADTTVKVDTAAQQIGTLADQVFSQLQQLQTLVVGSKQALRDAAGSLYQLRPDDKN